MGQSDNPEEPPAIDAPRHNQVQPFLRALITGAWLPPDLLVTWGERVLAVVAIVLVVWALVDIVRQGL
jgi:hypothetical protein